jgi:hypothetical protein
MGDAVRDEQVRQEAWQAARKAAALILHTDLTPTELSDAAWELATAFRDLDPGEDDQA